MTAIGDTIYWKQI